MGDGRTGSRRATDGGFDEEGAAKGRRAPATW